MKISYAQIQDEYLTITNLDKILKKKHEWTKLGEKWDGPFVIDKVHVNGNVTANLTEGVTERLNIRRIKPYRSA